MVFECDHILGKSVSQKSMGEEKKKSSRKGKQFFVRTTKEEEKLEFNTWKKYTSLEEIEKNLLKMRIIWIMRLLCYVCE
jgi:murein L,D-transpeptidase YafK